MQLLTSPLATGSLLDALEGWELDSSGAALMAAGRCSAAAGLGFAAAELEGAELEGASEALLLVCLSLPFATCLLGCPFFAACCGCFAWLASGRGPRGFSAVLLLPDAAAAGCSRAFAPCDDFAAACCSSLSAELGCFISSVFCKGHHS